MKKERKKKKSKLNALGLSLNQLERSKRSTCKYRYSGMRLLPREIAPLSCDDCLINIIKLYTVNYPAVTDDAELTINNLFLIFLVFLV